jgi:hypothetical protein
MVELVVNDELERIWKEVVNVLPRNFLLETEKDHEKSQGGELASRVRFEPCISLGKISEG